MILNDKVLDKLQKMGFEGLDLCLNESLTVYGFIINQKGQGVVMCDGQYTIKYFGDMDFLIACITDSSLHDINKVLESFGQKGNLDNIDEAIYYLKNISMANLVYIYNEFTGEMFLPDNWQEFKPFDNDIFLSELEKMK